ncbi:hypothetical protein [Oceaniferula marina]|nr:hypothetical protein [Oceaniferula marina]
MLILIFALFFSPWLHAEEEPAKADKPPQSGKYVFGYISTPLNLLNMLQKDEEESSEDDPFAAQEPETKLKPRKTLSEFAPLLDPSSIPLCLPQQARYRDLSKAVSQYGLYIKNPEWILLSTGPNADHRIYFCSTSHNADIIDQIFMVMCVGMPKSFITHVDLVSLKMTNHAPPIKTWKNLQELNPIPRMHLGAVTISGERSRLHLKSPRHSGSLDFELTIGENNLYYDGQIHFTCQIPDTDIFIQQQTAYTGQLDTPFIIDCGTYGNENETFLLIIHQQDITPPHSDAGIKILKRMDKIEGIYAKRPTNKTETEQKNIIRHYHANSSLLDFLNEYTEVKAQPLIRTQQQNGKAYPPDQHVFDITPCLRAIGYSFKAQQWVHYNKSTQKIIIYSPDYQGHEIMTIIDDLLPQIVMVNMKITFYEISNNPDTNPIWKLDQIKDNNALLLKSYATVTRSGEKSIFGEYTSKPLALPNKAAQKELRYKPCCEIETTISDYKQVLNMRVHLEIPPLGSNKTTTKLNSNFVMTDGVPTIVELGHPDSGKRTIVLVLQADVISPDGSLYRDRLKPLPVE